MKEKAKINLKDFSLEEIEQLTVRFGKKSFTGRQLYKWIFNQGVDDFNLMTNLSKQFRETLKEKCRISKIAPLNHYKSSDDTVKTVWELDDNSAIESVLIPDNGRLTLCLSSQAGCPIGCGFCATGIGGFKRNLTSGEIYDQYLLTKGSLEKDKRITNIVFMGMGEPFLNYDNVIKASTILNSQLGAGVSARKLTISTVGLVNGIHRLADENPRFVLAISLHSAIQEKRRKLIPIAKKYPLDMLKKAAIYYTEKADHRVTFEYLLIKDVNDGLEDAKALADFVRGIPCKINLIAYNEVEGTGYHKPDEKTVLVFRDYLYPRAPAVTLRKSKGTDIKAACGQLAGKRDLK
ncbi:MAG: 23S rRNA (adenine(2503)-C(2))-methyltransferase RlmN [candidate division Zixibacteria bacterium]|nr:23S rRNA (adenine(2503)-C(2))-methyltransferase RlmN [candidate division Zixibacteria bacterium]